MKSQNIIQNIIKGNPTIAKLEELCDRMHCDITDLFYPIDEQDAGEVKSEQSTQGKTTCQGIDVQGLGVSVASPAQPIQTTAFCPHCGAKVRVGVVLLGCGLI